jgi:hypothetical protein
VKSAILAIKIGHDEARRELRGSTGCAQQHTMRGQELRVNENDEILVAAFRRPVSWLAPTSKGAKEMRGTRRLRSSIGGSIDVRFGRMTGVAAQVIKLPSIVPWLS